MRRAALLAAAAVLATGCATAPVTPAATEPLRPPNDVHWVRTAAEYRALFIQTYRTATEQVRQLAAGRPAGTWAVILDADETVLDNSEYQRRIAQRGASFDTATWHAWVREVAADSLPGAAGFIATVRELGGRVAIVTNRDDDVCDPTRRNLQRLGIVVDVVLCQTAESTKVPRFEMVAQGRTPAGLPPLDVIAWVGDNIQDFPGATQQLRGGPPTSYSEFGRRWFIVPNPMYGSWERNPPR